MALVSFLFDWLFHEENDVPKLYVCYFGLTSRNEEMIHIFTEHMERLCEVTARERHSLNLQARVCTVIMTIKPKAAFMLNVHIYCEA
jgi:hypothetical protein